MHLEDPETVTGAVASLVSDSMRRSVVPMYRCFADRFDEIRDE
jgi:hypothetical protein